MTKYHRDKPFKGKNTIENKNPGIKPETLLYEVDNNYTYGN